MKPRPGTRSLALIPGGLVLLLSLPLLGALVAGLDVSQYFHFPPQAHTDHSGFSWPVFLGLAVVLGLVLLPFFVRGLTYFLSGKAGRSKPERPFPWWGWAGVMFTLAVWFLAWTRLEWFEPWQRLTYTPLWLGYILILNALTYRRSGSCMLLHRPVYFLLLFPASSLFWWFFEYLNRFVYNWHYIEVQHFSSLEYAAFATMAFATVLPAVLGTRDFLLTFSLWKRAYGNFLCLRAPRPKLLAAGVLLLSAAGLFWLGLYPDYLFPLLWVSPLLIILSLLALRGEPHILSPIKQGDWSHVLAAAAAALICGFFWEMWNFYSLAKWKYSIPFVHGFQVFEMPLLGYAGYLPFGLECAVIGDLLARILTNQPSRRLG